MGNKSSRLIFLDANKKLNEYMFEEILNENDGIRRGPFGGALKKEIFVKESDYVVYEQRNAIYDIYDFRYKISFEKYEEMKSFFVKEGDFLLSGAGTIGKISRVPKNASKGIINQALIRIRIDSEKVNPDYFLHWMRSEKMQHRLTSGNPGSAITNLVPLSEVKKWLISIPSMDEQRKIGVFFNLFDNLITLHQQELDSLKKTKQGFLQKMFPKERETIPNLRLKGYLEKWTTVKLEEKINIFNNLRVPVTSSNRVKGKIPYYGANGVQDYVEGCTHDGEFVLIAEDGANDLINYPVQYVTGKVWVNNHAHVVSGKSQKLDTLFLKYRINSMSISKYLVGGGRSKLNLEALKKLLIVIPPYAEQVEIGLFFRQLDEVIELKEQELEALKETKKGFLQKMFV